MQKNFEFKVGLFVAIGLVLLCGMIVFFGNFKLIENGYILRAKFNYTNSIKVNAPVRFSGVDIGKVKDINILEDGTNVELVFWIKEGVILREGVKVYINSLGVMGEKYVEFLGGDSEGIILTEGIPHLTGVNPVAMSDIVNMGQDIAQEVKSLIASVKVIVDDKETVADLKQAIKNSKDLTLNMNKFVANLNVTFDKNEDSIGKMINDFRASADMLSSNLCTISSILNKVESPDGTIGKLISDDALYRHLEELIVDIKKHPWKLLIKTREKKVRKPKEEKDKKRRRR